MLNFVQKFSCFADIQYVQYLKLECANFLSEKNLHTPKNICFSEPPPPPEKKKQTKKTQIETQNFEPPKMT